MTFSVATDPYEEMYDFNAQRESFEESEETTILLTKDATIKRMDELRNKMKKKESGQNLF
jgi:hypothetical protein